MKFITKRDGTKEEYNFAKIENAVRKAFRETSENYEENIKNVLGYFKNHFLSLKDVEEIQNAVEKSLINKKMYETAKAYILYRNQRENARNANSALTKTFNKLLNLDAKDSDLKRENANVNGNAPMGLMLFFGSETEKQYAKQYLISKKFSYEHDNGDFHIHDLNLYACTFNCCNIGIKKLLKNGFSTGHGIIREPQSISSALAITAIIIQANQNDMFGGQGIPLFDYELCPYVVKSFKKHLKQCIELSLGIELTDKKIDNFIENLFEEKGSVLDNIEKIRNYIYSLTKEKTDFVINKALNLLDNEIHQGMQAFIHNLNTMQSRCLPKDEQVVCLNRNDFPSISYKNINEIKENDYVLSYNTETKKYEYKKVKRALNNGNKDLLKIKIENGQEVRMTDDHKVLTDSGYVEAKDAENILTNNGFFKITEKLNDSNEEVFDIEVEDNHNFCVKDKNSDNFIVVHNCGSQVPFSSINYGTNTTGEGRLIIKNILRATDEGLGYGETSIFPVQIFKTKEGVNLNPEDKNFDLFEYACKVSAKRLYPNFVNIDVPGNIEYYVKGKPETEIATMGCRTKTLAQLDGTGRVTNRGNIAFTTINLPRLGILANHNIDKFFELFDNMILDARDELLERVKFLCTKKAFNFPFLAGQKTYLGSEDLNPDDSIEPILRHGTLAIGFLGLAECLVALIGKHHGESKEAYDLALKIVSRLREKTDLFTSETGWQFGCFATPAEGLSGRFTKIDKEKFGIIENVTSRKFYTNSFHIPVYFPITAAEKMKLEGPFHNLCNGGAISYIEMDGDATQNVQAIEKLVKYSKDCGISYFSINHNLDVCPICGYTGIINSDVCPHCGWEEGTEISVEDLKKKGINVTKFL